MRHFKKKTIVLCLASMLAVMGSCKAETYTNSLMSIKINSGSGGNISLTAFTSKNYTQAIKIEHPDSNAFSVILPETYSQITQMPDITGYSNIDSLQVSTYPYTPENKGYTQIYIKTKGNPTISTNTSLYIPDNHFNDVPNNISTTISSSSVKEPPQKIKPAEPVSYWDMHKSNTPQTLKEDTKNNNSETIQVPKTKTKVESSSSPDMNSEFANYNANNDISDNRTSESLIIVLGIVFITFLLFFLFFVGKEKMAALVGENNELDIEEDEKKKKAKKSIKKTINNLDQTYTNKTYSKIDTTIEKPFSEDYGNQNSTKDESESVKETSTIVDLDSLFNATKNLQKSTSDNNEKKEENDDLADFLNEFSIEDFIETESNDLQNKAEPENADSFNEELYNNIINDTNITFNESDINKIEKLIQNELEDEIVEHPEIFITNPIEVSKNKLLENILAEYAIQQDISFSKDDVDAIKKIMNVELDESFITDLRTNPQRTKQMAKEISEQKSIHKKPQDKLQTEVLSVKNLLPDLSEELKKQGNKKIESDAKPQIVYYSEGYEVSKLKVDSELSDISTALKAQDATVSRPSDTFIDVAEGYDVPTLHINIDELKENSDDIKEQKSFMPDENALLKSISNVTFKPFYEEDFSADKEQHLSPENETQVELIQEIPDVKAAEEELNSEENLKMESTSEEVTITAKEDNAIYNDKKIPAKNNIELVELKRQKPARKVRADENAQQLLALIEEKNTIRKTKIVEYKAAKVSPKTKEEQVKKALDDSNLLIDLIDNSTKTKSLKNADDSTQCEIDGIVYNVVKWAQCDDKIKCALAKNENNYYVIGVHNGIAKILKQYDNVKKENIAIRINEKLSDGIIQYLVKISSNKFVVNVSPNNMEFIMDLC